MEKCIFFYLSDEHNFLEQRSDEYDAFFYFDQVGVGRSRQKLVAVSDHIFGWHDFPDWEKFMSIC